MKRKDFIKRKFQGENSSRSKFFSRFSSLTNVFPRTLTHWKNVPSRKDLFVVVEPLTSRETISLKSRDTTPHSMRRFDLLFEMREGRVSIQTWRDASQWNRQTNGRRFVYNDRWIGENVWSIEGMWYLAHCIFYKFFLRDWRRTRTFSKSEVLCSFSLSQNDIKENFEHSAIWNNCQWRREILFNSSLSIRRNEMKRWFSSVGEVAPLKILLFCWGWGCRWVTSLFDLLCSNERVAMLHIQSTLLNIRTMTMTTRHLFFYFSWNCGTNW